MSGQGETKEDRPSTFAHVEDGPRSDTGHDASAEERALLRKIDLRLVPCVWIMYLMSYVSTGLLLAGHLTSFPKILTDWQRLQLDRSNIGNAYTVSIHPIQTHRESLLEMKQDLN